MTKIIVDNKLTYNCKYDVKVGDTVIIPAPWFMESKTTTGVVTKIGSDYAGNTVEVLAVNPCQQTT